MKFSGMQDVYSYTMYILTIYIVAERDLKSKAKGFNDICDWAYENRPCERKLHRVIFSLISFVPNALSHFRKLQKKVH